MTDVTTKCDTCIRGQNSSILSSNIDKMFDLWSQYNVEKENILNVQLLKMNTTAIPSFASVMFKIKFL